MLKRVLLIWLLAAPSILDAQDLRRDSAAVEIRSFDASAIEGFRNDRNFNYREKSEPVRSLWNRFWDWFWYQVDRLFSKENRGPVNFVLILLFLGVIVLFILKLVGDRSALFGRKGGGGLPYNVETENIHNISFDDAIRDALAAGNYRMAVRLLYLHSLKLLSDQGLIEWKPGKTNHAYVTETASHPSHDSFRHLTSAFEHAWYGGEDVSETDFNGIEEAFVQFKNQVVK